MTWRLPWEDETIERPALPVGELVQPLPIAAMVLLVINDHFLKGAGLLPSWITGKLSDFAGLFFFPLLCTALVDTGLALTRARVDPSLSMRKAWVGCVVTGVVFAATELVPDAAAAYEAALSTVGIAARATADPTDLVALVMLPCTLAIARRHVRRVPFGRVAWSLRARETYGTPITRTFADVSARSRTPATRETLATLVEALEQVATGAPATRANEALAQMRSRSGTGSRDPST